MWNLGSLFYLWAQINLLFVVEKKVAGIFDSMSDDDDEFFTPSVNKTISKSAEPKQQKKELTESDKKALRYIRHYTETHYAIEYFI